MKKIRIGSRKSLLAMRQAEIVASKLRELEIESEIIGIETTGDKLIHADLALIGGKGLFLKEIEERLVAGQIDIAVHSMKDVPVELPSGLVIPCMLKREDIRDVFISYKYDSLDLMDPSAVVGTSSLRRKYEVLSKRSDLNVINFRGNVVSRIEKVKKGIVDACIIAYSGVKRLGMLSEVKQVFAINEFLPAVGQGAIGIECRADDDEIRDMLQKINCFDTFREVSAEREFMRVLGGSCTVPLAALAIISGENAAIYCKFFDENGKSYYEEASCSPEDLNNTAHRLADIIMHKANIE
jgi:hydroxymethylbilane synthase